MMAGCWGSGSADSPSAKEDAFKEVIGISAPTAVTDIRSSFYFMRDDYVRWLRFKCDPVTLQRIRLSAGFVAASSIHPPDAPGYPDRTRNPNAPEWWWELNGAGAFTEYERVTSKDDGSDTAHLWIDWNTGTVFARREVMN
jgi:hypothetical protein